MPKPTTIVLVERPAQRVYGLKPLKSIVEQAKAEFNESEHHVILLPENYFGSGFFAPHEKIKPEIEAVRAMLPEKWALAFAHNEWCGIGRAVNAGYLVTKGGYQVRPKKGLELPDKEAIQKSFTSPANAKGLANWRRYKEKFAKKGFPKVKLNGTEFEHRVCVDFAGREQGKGTLLVSANNMVIARVEPHMQEKTAIINDKTKGARVLHDGAVVEVTRHSLGEVNASLAGKNIRLAFFSPNPQR